VTHVPAPAPAPAPAPVLAAVPANTTFILAPDHTVITATQKHAKYAVSALQYEDVATAASHLQQALALLQPYTKQQ
jgi:vacuolar protein sorting-associated protein VTA1